MFYSTNRGSKFLRIRGRFLTEYTMSRIACWIPKVTHAHSEYLILIAFSLQQWLHECAWMVGHPYFACLFSVWAPELLDIYAWDLTCTVHYRGRSQFPPLYILQSVKTIRRTQVAGKESLCGEINHLEGGEWEGKLSLRFMYLRKTGWKFRR